MSEKGYIPHRFQEHDTEDRDEHCEALDEHCEALEELHVSRCQKEGREPYPMSEREKKWDEEDAAIDALLGEKPTP